MVIAISHVRHGDDRCQCTRSRSMAGMARSVGVRLFACVLCLCCVCVRVHWVSRGEDQVRHRRGGCSVEHPAGVLDVAAVVDEEEEDGGRERPEEEEEEGAYRRRRRRARSTPAQGQGRCRGVLGRRGGVAWVLGRRGGVAATYRGVAVRRCVGAWRRRIGT